MIDENGKSLNPNDLGEICYKKSTKFIGFYNDPDRYSTIVDADGWTKSGDIGYIDEEGFVFVLDPIKNCIYNGKFRISSMDIEKLINQVEGVCTSCVVGIFDKNYGGEIIYAFVIKKPGFNLTEKIIEDYVNNRVDAFEKKIHGGVHFVNSFPKTFSGKIFKRKLKEQAMELAELRKKS